MKTKRNLIHICLLGALLLSALTSGAQTVTRIAAGGYHSLFAKSDGSLWAMGLDFYGELGDGLYYIYPIVGTNQPEVILGTNLETTVTGIAAGLEHSLFLKSNDSMWGMGYNVDGQLGLDNYVNTNVPQQILPGITPVVTAIATEAGANHSLFLKSDGSLWSMGFDYYGELGDGTNTNTDVPRLSVASGVTTISAGGYHSLFIKNDGSLWAMGWDSNGQLGDGGSPNGTNLPEMIVPTNVTAISGGGLFSLFLKNDGSLWGMGGNDHGQLGDGSQNSTNRPIMIVPSGVTAISAGGYFSLFLKDDGSLWGMGANAHGQLGDGTTNEADYPEMIMPGGVTAIAAGGGHSLFVTSDGSLWAMGYNNDGQLGDGTTNDAYSPEMIVAGSSVVSPSYTLAAQVLTGGHLQLSFSGTPGASYALDRSLSLAPPNWVPQVTNSAGPAGVLVFTTAPNQATNNFWRIRAVP